MKKIQNKNSGFIALMSSIIISSILLITAINTGFTSFYNNFNILDSELKEMSSSLADACLDVALLNLNLSPTYTGNTTVSINENSCFIGPVIISGPNKTFNIKAVYQNAHTNLKVTVDGTNFSVISLMEILTF